MPNKLTTPGVLFINEALPKALQRDSYQLDKDGIAKLMTEVQEKYPDQYKDIVQRLYQFGGYAAQSEGHTISLSDTLKPIEVKLIIKQLRANIDKIIYDDSIKDDDKELLISDLTMKSNDLIKNAIMSSGKERNNPLEVQARSGSRGNANQFRQIVAGDGLVSDHRDRVIGVPILNGYSEGLDPVEYFAGSYGARKGSVCLHEGTLVLMADGTAKTIKEIEVGDVVIGTDLNCKGKPVKVVAKYDNGYRQCNKYTFRVNNTNQFVDVVATPNHRLLAKIKAQKQSRSIYDPSLIQLDRAKIYNNHSSEFVALPLNEFDIDNGLVVDEALLAGLMLGDGCMAPSARGQYTFSCADQSLIDDITTYAGEFEIDLVKDKGDNYNWRLNFGDDNPVKEWLKTILGDKLAHDKNLPSDIWSWSNRSICELLAGLYSTDGSVYKRGKNKVSISLTSTSMSMIYEVKRLLEQRLGIYTSDIHWIPKHKKVFATHDQFEIGIAHTLAVKKFHELIKLVGKKRKLLDELCDELHFGHNNTEYGFKIHSIEAIETEQHVYDIEVDSPEHIFALYNGLISSNSTKFCLKHDTPVRMANGDILPINEICIGDLVLGSTNKAIVGPVRVTGVSKNGIKSCKRYTFNRPNNKTPIRIECSPDHQVLFHNRAIRDSWNLLPISRCENREPQDPMWAHMPYGSSYQGKEPIYLPYLIGLISGGGIFNGSTLVFKGLVRDGLYEVVIPYLRKAGMHLERNSTYGYHSVAFATDEAKDYFFSYLVSLGIHSTNPDQIKLPLEVWLWNDSDLHQFLKGFLESKGSVDHTEWYISIDSKQLELIEELHDLLNYRIGLLTGHIVNKPCGISESIDPNIKAYTWHLRMQGKNSLQRLYELIEFSGTFRNRFDILMARNGLWDKPNIVKCSAIEDIGDHETYDIEVDSEDHLFVLANGLIVSNSTQEAGFFGKQLAQAAHRVVVTEQDCGATTGIPVVANDPDNVGALLSAPVGKYKAGTPITPAIIKDLGNQPIYIRSALTCQASNGICAMCAGIREKGRLPDIGDNIGLPSAQALGERMAQGMLNAKHGGGQVTKGKDTKNEPSKAGFNYVNQLIQSPTNFAGAATLSTRDGRVQSIDKAEQGGHYITVDGEKYFVPHDQDVTVAIGDQIEKGDSMSNGTPNPFDIAEQKGIGEGRLYFMKALYDGFKNSGIKPNRRNVEVIARSLINHVQITGNEGHNGFLPDDIVSYDDFKRDYEPREGSIDLAPDRSLYRYLEKPILHYSIGTRITPRVIKTLKDNKINSITSHDEEPMFKPHVVRAMENGMRDPNWMTRLGGSYLGKGFTEAVRRGRTADIHDTSFIPSLAKGTEFGKDLNTTGKY